MGRQDLRAVQPILLPRRGRTLFLRDAIDAFRHRYRAHGCAGCQVHPPGALEFCDLDGPRGIHKQSVVESLSAVQLLCIRVPDGVVAFLVPREMHVEVVVRAKRPPRDAVRFASRKPDCVDPFSTAQCCKSRWRCRIGDGTCYRLSSGFGATGVSPVHIARRTGDTPVAHIYRKSK